MSRNPRLARVLLPVLLLELLLPPARAGAAPSDGSTLALDRSVPGQGEALGAALPADLFSGSASYTVAIEVPPGTGGMTPQLALRYSSAGARDSWVGAGWSLGLPSLSRSLKRGTPSYDDGADSFVLAGEELVPESANPALPRAYHTRREGFLRIRHEADGSWTVTRKDGTTLRFGLSAAARITNGAGQVFEWLLSEQEDLHGNVFSVSYVQPDPGSAYPSEVRYTLRRQGSSLASLPGGDRVVAFTLEAREDAPLSYTAGFLRRLGRRLARIDVRVGPTLVRRYELDYVQSPDTYRTLLAQVALHGADADAASPTPPLVTRFDYHSNVVAGTTGWALDSSWSWPANLALVQSDASDNGVRLGDVDGDGLLDLLKGFADVDLASSTATMSADSGVYLNTGAGFSNTKSAQWVLPSYTGQESILAPFFAQRVNGKTFGSGRVPVDLTGDGRVDIAGGAKVLLWNSGQFQPWLVWPWFESSPAGWVESPVSYDAQGQDWFYSLLDSFYSLSKLGYESTRTNLLTVGGNTRFADLTGDGLPELVVRGTDNWHRFVSGTGYACAAAEATSYVVFNEGHLVFRLPVQYVDAVTVPRSPWSANLPACAGATYVHSNEFEVCDPATDATCAAALYHSRSYALGYPYSGQWTWWYESHYELGNDAVDVNADGLADHVSAYSESGTQVRRSFLNDGQQGYVADSGWNLPTQADQYTLDLTSPYSVDRGVRLADVNGDGRVDVLLARAGTAASTWLHDGDPNAPGTGPWRTSTAWRSPLDFVDSQGRDEGARLVDVDGDGMTDLLRSKGTTRQVYRNRGSIPDLLVEIEGPYGGSTTLGYTPSSAFDHTGGDGVPDLPQVFPLLTSITLDAGSGAVGTTTLEYQDGRLDPEERELRGFGLVVETRADGRETTTRFHQDAARAGLVESVEVRSAGGALLAATLHEYTGDADGLPPYTSLPSRLTRLEVEGTATPRYSRMELAYDGGGPLVYGNLTAQVEWGEVDAQGNDLDPADTRHTQISYATPNLAAYLVDRPRLQLVRVGGVPGAGSGLRATLLLYDGDLSSTAVPLRGDLTRRIDFLSEPGKPDPTASFEYDAYGNLVAQTDPRANAGEGGGTTTFEYDPSFQTFLAASTNPLGHRTTLDYAPAAECAVAHSAGAGLVHVERGPNDQSGGTGWLRCYDAFGRIKLERAPDALAETTWLYTDTSGAAAVAETHRTNGGSGARIQTMLLDGLGRPKSSSSSGAQGKTVLSARSYDGVGRVALETAPYFQGTSAPPPTTYGYDALDRPVTVTLPGSGRVVTFQYDVPGRTVTLDPNGNRVERSADVFGNVVRVREFPAGAGQDTLYAYDRLGQLVQVTDPGGNLTAVQYDRLGRRTLLDDADTDVTSFAYDSNGNLVHQQTPRGTLDWSYDDLDRPLARRLDGSPTPEASWSYDLSGQGLGRLEQRVDAAGTYRVGAYDRLGRVLTERRDVGGRPYFRYTTYDLLGQIATRTYPDSRSVTWLRDAAGYLTALRAGSGLDYASAIQWDAEGRVASWKSAGNVTTTRSYDATTARLASIQVQGGALLEHLAYGYDPGDRVTAITDFWNRSLDRSFVYDGLDRLTRATGPYSAGWAPGVAIHFDYDGLGNLRCQGATNLTGCVGGTAMTYPAPGPSALRPHAPLSVDGQTVGYDAAGNTTSVPGPAPRSYAYDVLGRMTSASNGSVPLASFVYDATGALAKLTDHTATPAEVRHLLFDDFEWNATAKQAELQLFLGGTRIASQRAAYNPGGGGCAGTLPGLPGDGSPFDLLWPGLAAFAVLWLEATLRRRPRGARLRAAVSLATAGAFLGVTLLAPYPALAQAALTGMTYYHADHLGSSVVLTNETGAVLDRALYRPFGGRVPASAGGSTEAPTFGFTGQRYAKAVGIYDYGARWYEPRLGRFLQPDPVVPGAFNPQALNRYAYVFNNPIGMVDPTGHWPSWGDVWGGVTGFFGSAWGGFNDYVVDPFYSRVIEPVVSAPGRIADIWRNPSYGLKPVQVAGPGAATPLSTADKVRATFDVLGLIPGFGEPFDAASGVISAFQGDWAGAGASALAVVPFVGWTGSAVKGARTAERVSDVARGAANPKIQRALERGQKAHAERLYPPGFKKEVPLPSGRRMDAYNRETREVLELKPNNPRAVQRGERQIREYCRECDEVFGPGHRGRVETYD